MLKEKRKKGKKEPEKKTKTKKKRMRERSPEKDCCTWLTQMMTSVCVVQLSVTTTVHIYVHHFQDLSHPDNQIEKNQMLFLGL